MAAAAVKAEGKPLLSCEQEGLAFLALLVVVQVAEWWQATASLRVERAVLTGLT